MDSKFGCAGAAVALALGTALVGTAIWGASVAHADHHDAGHGHAEHGDAPGQHDATASHRFEDPERWAERFENPERDAWQKPEEIVAALVTRKDLVIADIGSATGYFPVRFARAVPGGFVYGADIEPGMVTYLNDRARRERVENLVSVIAGPDGPHLPRAVDLVFLCNTYHHLNDRVEYLKRLGTQLKAGSRIAVVDFRLDSEKGPPHKLDPALVEEEMAAAGYPLAERHDFLPEQYFLVFSGPEVSVN